ncbi:MAG: ABC transporter permease [Gemmiger sp.]|nr:ABC transporter permease [Gemmiger sp.]
MAEKKIQKNPLSLQLNADDFNLASGEEKQSLVVMRESVSFWKDGFRRLGKNKIAMVSLFFIVLIMIFAYIVPVFYPYTYAQQIRGSENLAPFTYSEKEQARIDAGESVFPHVCGTDKSGRDYAVRLMLGARISLTVGLLCSVLVLLIGATFGAISGFLGGWADMIMMRITDILYTIPDILLIILLAVAFKEPLEVLASKPGFGWLQTLGPNLVSIFIVFALLYWVGMARIVRSQVLTLKEAEYVTAARALGASGGRIIKKHLLTNCIGTLIVTTTLQIPSAIFTESYLSFLGLGVASPMPSLGSLATDAVKGMNTYPHLLLLPALLISVIILVFNLFGDGLRDAFDPKLKN